MLKGGPIRKSASRGARGATCRTRLYSARKNVHDAKTMVIVHIERRAFRSDPKSADDEAAGLDPISEGIARVQIHGSNIVLAITIVL